jgi:hypothetical protein
MAFELVRVTLVFFIAYGFIKGFTQLIVNQTPEIIVFYMVITLSGIYVLGNLINEDLDILIYQFKKLNKEGKRKNG